MANFDMHGQSVTNQYNAGRDINFGVVQTPEDLVAVFEQLNKQLASAKDAGVLDEATATDAQYQVTKAMQQAGSPAPDKEIMMKHLFNAKALLTNIVAASGLIKPLIDAVQAVEKLFS